MFLVKENERIVSCRKDLKIVLLIPSSIDMQWTFGSGIWSLWQESLPALPGCSQLGKGIDFPSVLTLLFNTIRGVGVVVAKWVELVVQWLEGRLHELHAEVSLSKILNPRTDPDVQLAPCGAAIAISKGPAMSWRLIQCVPWPSTMSRTGFGPSKPRNPSGG